MSVQSEINRINTAVTGQADLIAQIQTALEGKAAGGGGGVSAPTCTVTLGPDFGMMKGATIYTKVLNGVAQSVEDYLGSDTTFTNVVKGIFTIVDKEYVAGNIEFSLSGCEYFNSYVDGAVCSFNLTGDEVYINPIV